MRRWILSVLFVTFLAACTSPVSPTYPPSVRQVTLYYSSDEHGYLQAMEDDGEHIGGAAELMALLQQEGYDPDSNNALLLSGGDMWTGPAISSWFQGGSTVQVFNALGWDASALGNHDFDFGQEVLSVRAAEADFPFLAANLTEEATGDPPAYAQPYVIRETNGVQIGIIGLSYIKTADIVMPAHTAGLLFEEYETALRQTVPQVQAEGADIIVVIAHVCPTHLRPLADTAAELGISLLAGGHCHLKTISEQDNVLVIGAGSHWEYIVRIDMLYDTETGQVIQKEAQALENSNISPPDAAVNELVSSWADQIDELLGEVIGYTETGIEVDWPMYNMVTDAWLWFYPQGDVAISNMGGFREIIPPGEITLADIVATLPFENMLVDVTLTGEELLENISCCGGAVSGMTVQGGLSEPIVTLADGSELDPEATYHVLVIDYIYQGGDDYLFADQNPDAYDTGIHWRDPLIQWLRVHATSPEQPLESLLDDTRRMPDW